MQQSVGAQQAAIAIKLLFRDALGIDLRSLHAAGTPGHAPGGCAGCCVPGQSARQYEGQGLWTSLPSLGPQEECPWRLSDVIPARMVSHTLRTWTCSHLT